MDQYIKLIASTTCILILSSCAVSLRTTDGEGMIEEVTSSTPIDSLPDPAAFECINRGADGTLDAFMRVNSKQYWGKPHLNLNLLPDSLSYAGGDMLYTLKVHPRRDSMGRYFCNSKPLTHPQKWNHDADNNGTNDCLRRNVPPVVAVTDIEQAINDAYSKVGINFTLIDQGPYLANYEITIDGKMDYQESLVFHATKTGTSYSSLSPNPIIELFIVDELVRKDPVTGKKKPSEGRGLMQDGKEVQTVFLVPQYSTSVTAPHELGHGVFGLQHPDESGGPDYDNLDTLVHHDLKNFMMSGNKINREKNPGKVLPRKYQWTKIGKKQ